MKIKFNRAKPTEKPIFSSLGWGDVFTLPGGDVLYMKVYDSPINVSNAIALDNGSRANVNWDAEVFPRPLAVILVEGE